MKNKNLGIILEIFKKPLWIADDPSKINQRIIRKYTNLTCKYFPKFLNKRILRFINYFNCSFVRIFSIFGYLYTNIYLIEGKEKFSGKKISILYINKNERLDYLKKILFQDKIKYKKIDKIFIWSFTRRLNKNLNGVDAVFYKSDRFYSHLFEKKDFIVIPEWITMTIDTSDSLENLIKKFSKSGKEDLRKVKKYGYTYEITRDAEKLKYFYYQMYLQYIKKRHGKMAKIINFYAFRNLLEMGSKLMLIKYKDEYVQGSLFSVKKDKIITTYTGLLEGKEKLLKKGISAAPYYFLIKWAKENNLKLIDFGKCRSFLNDGLLKYKRKWGAKIKKVDSHSPDIFGLKFNNTNEGITSFLINNPFLITQKDKLKIFSYNFLINNKILELKNQYDSLKISSISNRDFTKIFK